MDILQLPAELRQEIFKYCSVVQLKVLSCVNKAHHEAVQHRLWINLRIPWTNMTQGHSQLLTINLQKLKLTEEVRFCGDCGGGSCSSGCGNGGGGGGCCGGGGEQVVNKWGQVSGNFKKVVKQCGVKLKKLNVCGLMGDVGMRYDSQKYFNHIYGFEICFKICFL